MPALPILKFANTNIATVPNPFIRGHQVSLVSTCKLGEKLCSTKIETTGKLLVKSLGT